MPLAEVTNAGASAPAAASKAAPTVEQTYQKLTQHQHILQRPDTYVGSIEMNTCDMFVMDDATGRMAQRKISYVPGLYKIFDEILVNAADNKQRDSSMTELKVEIDPEKNKISVFNNGRGIPVVIHKEHNIYVPELIFSERRGTEVGGWGGAWGRVPMVPPQRRTLWCSFPRSPDGRAQATC